MGIPQDTINGTKSALDNARDIRQIIYNYSKKPTTIKLDDLKKAGVDKLSKDMFGFIDNLKNIIGNLQPMISAAELNNKEFDNIMDKYDKLSEYRNIIDKIDEHMAHWRGVMFGDGSGSRTPYFRTTSDDSVISKQLFFIGSRPTGTCSTCDKEPANDDMLCCKVCRNHFHAVNCLDEHKNKKLGTQTLLKNLRSASSNYKWMCDVCSTRFEQESCSNVQSTAITLTETVNKLTSQMDQMGLDMGSRFDEITAKIVESNSANVWSDRKRLSNIRSSLLIKPDENGKPVELDVVRELAMKNGIQVDTAKVTNDSKMFINLPSTKNRDKLTPLIQSSSLAKPDQIVTINSKLPTTVSLSLASQKQSLRTLLLSMCLVKIQKSRNL